MILEILYINDVGIVILKLQLTWYAKDHRIRYYKFIMQMMEKMLYVNDV